MVFYANELPTKRKKEKREKKNHVTLTTTFRPKAYYIVV